MIILKDGRPLESTPQMDAGKVSRLVRDGVWTEDDLAWHGLTAGEPFVAPEGKRTVGEPRYVDGREVYDVEDVPPPPPPPTPLERIGLSEAEFNTLVAEAIARQTVKVVR